MNEVEDGECVCLCNYCAVYVALALPANLQVAGLSSPGQITVLKPSENITQTFSRVQRVSK